MYYYLNALEGSAAFQSIYINFQQCFSSTVWELDEEEKLKEREDEEELKGCLEDTRPELCRLKMTTSCLSLETKRSAIWFQMHYIVLLIYLAYEYPSLREECLKLEWEHSACSLRAENPKRAMVSHWEGERTATPGCCRGLLRRVQVWKPGSGKRQRIQSAWLIALPGNMEEKDLWESSSLSQHRIHHQRAAHALQVLETNFTGHPCSASTRLSRQLAQPRKSRLPQAWWASGSWKWWTC